MKTSYKLLILAGLILFGTLTAFDFALRSEYEKGKYKEMSVVSAYTDLNYKGFNEIQINPASSISTDIIYSDTFQVSVHNGIKEHLKIRQVGSRLIVDIDLKGENFFRSRKSLIIKCPFIKTVSTNSFYKLDGKSFLNDKVRSFRDIDLVGVFLKGFKQDSLLLSLANISSVSLENNKVNYMKASIGAGRSGESTLNIGTSNEINFADIDVQNKSKLNLIDIIITQPNFKVSDSAQVYLSGASLKLLKK